MNATVGILLNIALAGKGDLNDAASLQQGLLRTLSAVTCSPIAFRFLKSVRLTWKKIIQSQRFLIKTKDSQIFFENGPTMQPL